MSKSDPWWASDTMTASSLPRHLDPLLQIHLDALCVYGPGKWYLCDRIARRIRGRLDPDQRRRWPLRAIERELLGRFPSHGSQSGPVLIGIFLK